MRKTSLKLFLVLGLLASVYAGVNAQTDKPEGSAKTNKQQTKANEPAGKFVPTEQLRADDAVAFPVDI